MLTDKSRPIASAVPLTIPERLLKAKSLLSTIKLACLYKVGAGEEFWDIHETIEFAESIVGECVTAYETEQNNS